MTLYAAFAGEVHCEPLAQEGSWRISGRARGLPPAAAGEPLQLLLNGARDLDPPAVLHDAELEVVDAATGASPAWQSPAWQPPAATAAVAVLAPAARIPAAAPARRLGCVLRGRGYGRAFSLRSAQVQLGVSPALLALMAPPPAPWTMRAVAWLLLNLVRIPGVAGLVALARADHRGD